MSTSSRRMSRNLLALTATIITFLIACSPDIDELPRPPAYYIHKSEQLEIPEAVELPADLPAGNSRVATYFAEGVQKYKSQLKAGQNDVYEWVFVAPLANLYATNNKKVGIHGAGPYWALFNSTDSIFAQQFTPVRSAPSPVANSIDWLLLKPKNGTAPSGVFAEVDYIQRIDTRGGKAPATPPNSATQTVDVPYVAVYRFSKQN